MKLYPLSSLEIGGLTAAVGAILLFVLARGPFATADTG